MSKEKIKIIFIGGAGRSGSTLLEAILGELDGFFAVGELINIWHIKNHGGYSCGCGVPLAKCEFWNEVFDSLDINEHQIAETINYRNEVGRIRYIPQILIKQLRDSQFNDRLDKYIKVIHSLYSKIKNISQSKVLIDSSKNVAYAYILSQIPDFEVHLVHLVRDSRAVGYSWQKKKVKNYVYSQEEYMSRFNLLKIVTYWNQTNILFNLIPRLVSSYTLLRYEDLTNNVEAAISKICHNARENSTDTAQYNQSTITLNPSHSIGGNPIIFQKDKLEIKQDNEWQNNMGMFAKSSITLLTAPLLLQYKYLF